MKTLGTISVLLVAGLLGPMPSLAQSVCENACEECAHDPDWWYNLGFGVGLHMTWTEPTGSCTDPTSCAPWAECRGPGEEEDTKPQEVLDAELDELLVLGRHEVLDWVTSNRGDFRLAVVEDGTLKVANRCGAVITWVSLEPSHVAAARALLAEE